jgi:putative ubiquitin-RnfH superfamily antitoxin RatB of RatAB toxin-antitoxin module
MLSEDTSEALPETIVVEVAYALPDKQKIISLQVSPGTTARQAVRESNIVAVFPEIDVDAAILGVFSHTLGTKGMPSAEEYVLKPMDRVEIYRPLIADPKEVRKQRAAKAREERAAQKAQQKTGK